MKYKNIILACVLAALFVAIPNLIDTSYEADESYWLRMAEDVRTQGIVTYDRSVVTPSTITPNPFTLLVAGLSFFGKHGWILGQSILAIMAMLLLYSIRLPSRDSIALVFLVSPLFFASFSALSDNGLYLVFTLFCIWLFQSKWWLWGFIPLMLVSARSPVDLVMMMLLVTVTGIVFRKYIQIAIGYILLIPFALLHIFFLQPRILFGPDSLLNRIFFEFGSIGGVSIIMLLLCMVAIYVLWRSRTKFSIASIVLILCLIYSIIDGRALLYLSTVVVALAGISLDFLLKRDWTLPRVKLLFFTMVFALLVFNGMSAATAANNPSQSFLDSLERMNDLESGTVFTHHSYGDVVALNTKKPVVSISRTENILDPDNHYLDTLQLFHTTDIETSARLLSKYHVKYIIITEEMEQELVWEIPNRGLSFLTNTHPSFQLVIEEEDVRVYRFIS